VAKSLPDTPDALKLAHQQLKYADARREVGARAWIYPLLVAYLAILVSYSVFLIVALGLTASAVWNIPWTTLTAMFAGNCGLGASSYFFRSPMNQLFPHGHPK
jgi:hypothetical protein